MENETIEIEVDGLSAYLDPEQANRYFGIEAGDTKEITVGELLGTDEDEYEIEPVEFETEVDEQSGQFVEIHSDAVELNSDAVEIRSDSAEHRQEASVVQDSLDQSVITSAQDLLDLGLENVFVIPRINARHSALLVAIRPHQTLVIKASVGKLSRPGSSGSNSVTLHGEVFEDGAEVRFEPQASRDLITVTEGMRLVVDGREGRTEIWFPYCVKVAWMRPQPLAKQQAHGTAWFTLTRASGSELRISFEYLITKD